MMSAGKNMQSVILFNELFTDLKMPALENPVLEGSTLDNLIIDPHNQEYEGFDFSIADTRYRSRLARKTPKKAGYFLAIWEKDSESKNSPFAANAFPDYLIVNIIDGERRGQFIFPNIILMRHGILKSPSMPGKMAFRVYTPWDKDLNMSAAKTAKWQLPFFVALPASNPKMNPLLQAYL